MLVTMKVLGLIALLLTVCGHWERRRHHRARRRIPIRIHVNGTRGKSTVVRLIAAGLREGGIRTFAKTSGSAAMQMFPDGRELPVPRVGRPNVLEQTKVIMTASDHRAQALVVECMAIDPRLQVFSELDVVRATHGVITNVGPDHLDVMGPTEAEVAEAFAGTVPISGKLFTVPGQHLETLMHAARDRGTSPVVVHAQVEDRNALLGFRHLEHPENVALALKVCESLGVERGPALRGMHRAEPDPGAARIEHFRIEGHNLIFVNAFAANDPQSSRRIWDIVKSRHPEVPQRILLLNCRADRADRSRQLAESCPQWEHVNAWVVTGTGARIFSVAAIRHGIPQSRIHHAMGGPENVLRTILDLSKGSVLVVGVGNMHCGGMEFTEYLRGLRETRE